MKLVQKCSNLIKLVQTCSNLSNFELVFFWENKTTTNNYSIYILHAYLNKRVKEKTNNKNRTTKNKVPWNLWSYCRSEKEEENIIFSIHDFVATNRTNITVLNNIYWFLKKCFVSLFQLRRFTSSYAFWSIKAKIKYRKVASNFGTIFFCERSDDKLVLKMTKLCTFYAT